ncbi:hypothetical protein F0267_26080 [Vibrio coralliilyticus]|uniref:hypothetical protein n=1 Tax=Vibrio TaxID=662 RepID=UPI00148D383C|nr:MULTISPECIES: hypothetical protein [Vibrio]NOH26184.1 hypothetical protein [Vibrio europaeus]NOH41699.1 hypothetical protein [Vibrio coralliilyticus]
MTDRVYHSQVLQLNDITMPRGVVEFAEPTYNPIYEDVDGTFIADAVVVGFERVEGSVKIKGVGASIAKRAIKNGASNIIIFSSNGTDKGVRVDKEHVITAQVRAEWTPHKIKERQELTLHYIVSKHRFVDAGDVITDVDIKTGRYLINGEEFNV